MQLLARLLRGFTKEPLREMLDLERSVARSVLPWSTAALLRGMRFTVIAEHKRQGKVD